MTTDNAPDNTPETAYITPRKRPKAVSGLTERMAVGCGSLYVTVNSDDLGICEVFTSLGKAGGCAAAQLEGISRLVSMALRAGIAPATIIKHLRGIRCPSPGLDEGVPTLSCADAVAIVLQLRTTGEREALDMSKMPGHNGHDEVSGDSGGQGDNENNENQVV